MDSMGAWTLGGKCQKCLIEPFTTEKRKRGWKTWTFSRRTSQESHLWRESSPKCSNLSCSPTKKSETGTDSLRKQSPSKKSSNSRNKSRNTPFTMYHSGTQSESDEMAWVWRRIVQRNARGRGDWEETQDAFRSDYQRNSHDARPTQRKPAETHERTKNHSFWGNRRPQPPVLLSQPKLELLLFGVTVTWSKSRILCLIGTSIWCTAEPPLERSTWAKSHSQQSKKKAKRSKRTKTQINCLLPNKTKSHFLLISLSPLICWLPLLNSSCCSGPA